MFSGKAARPDTVNVALVAYSAPMPTAEAERFEAYLKARLNLKSLSIVNVGNSITFKQRSPETSNPK